ncbi:MAG TPA: YkgJ family cysteine cluster protein [Planctomycetota bacterium]|nr:YkgJ family cysteine cluster protein [Planctomycetota bacterium]
MSEAWYADGLRFSCTQCGNCCKNHGDYAFVNLSPRDLQEIPRFLGISVEQFLARYATKEPGHHPTLRMDEPQCPFLDANSRCTIYAVRPMQCRTWPFWRSNLEQETWEGAVKSRCPGVGHGELHSQERIDALAHATESEFTVPGTHPATLPRASPAWPAVPRKDGGMRARHRTSVHFHSS